MNDAQVLGKKFSYHVASLRLIALPAEIDIAGYGADLHIDHSSVMILARAALETYLTFTYIYGSYNHNFLLCHYFKRMQIYKS